MERHVYTRTAVSVICIDIKATTFSVLVTALFNALVSGSDSALVPRYVSEHVCPDEPVPMRKRG
jgi:hypothetical protein